MSEFRFDDEPGASRFTLHRDTDLVGVLDYKDDGKTVALVRSYTIPTFRGHGYAGVLVEHAVDEIERRGDRQIIPVCWYVAQWFQQHPERAGILKADTRAGTAGTGA